MRKPILDPGDALGVAKVVLRNGPVPANDLTKHRRGLNVHGLTQLGSTLPIVFLSGYPDVPTTVKTIKAGAEDFLTKPVTSELLLRAVEQAMAHYEASRGKKRKPRRRLS